MRAGRLGFFMNGFRRTIGVGSTLSLLLVGLVFAAPAHAGHVACGQTITVSTVLDSDVGPCPGIGIRIGADNVTLDLNGHTVFGAPGTGTVSNPQIGIETVNHQSGVTIRNGTVTEFDTGIFLFDGGGNTITEMNLIRNQGRLGLIWGEGIQMYLSDDNRIIRNRIVDNGPFDGVVVFDGSRNLIDNNLIQGNRIGVPSTAAPQRNIGVWISFIGDEPTFGNVISNNIIDFNGLDGVQLAGGTSGARVLNNQITRNGLVGGSVRYGDGVFVGGTFNLVADNRVQGNGANGIGIRAAASPAVGKNNSILRNQAFGNGAGPNPSPDFDLRDDNANCDANIWNQNQFGTRNQACIN